MFKIILPGFQESFHHLFELSSFLTTFDFVRTQTYILFFAVAFLFTACPPSGNYNSDLKKFQENNNNLPDCIKATYDGITYSLSSMFYDDYDTDYVIQDDAETQVIYDLSLYFTVESFEKRDIEIIKFAFENDLDDVAAVHKYYIHKRSESVNHPFVSEEKSLDKSIHLNGFIQVVEGKTYEYNEGLDYFIATFKVGEKIYVMQMIGKAENMSYLYDDFIKILRSVH